ncbi:hypothetical protein D9611_014612 [Ephemerocybe angulata]|uniref:Uncharacterized protein n=1 Tax=Ephemerocybe angulata TaxID=980116 RepID=A0A8H5CBW0_9AGAR|nr:hypothetical protein D9611_014612 [Tulosesus angulatus]
MTADVDDEEDSMGGLADNIRREEKEMDEGSGEDELSDEELDMFDDLLQGEGVREMTEPVRLVLTKLRKLAYAIKNSPTIILPKWFSIIRELADMEPEKRKKLSLRMMPRDVATRWNSTYDMVKFCWIYRKAIDRITEMRQLDLRKYEISEDEDEWNIVKELRDNLKVISSPFNPYVIPAMDEMHRDLKASVANTALSKSMRSALSLGLDLSNKYYSLTNDSEVYRIAIAQSYIQRTSFANSRKLGGSKGLSE